MGGHRRPRRFPRTALTPQERRDCYSWLRALGKTPSEARQLRDKTATARKYRSYHSDEDVRTAHYTNHGHTAARPVHVTDYRPTISG